MFSEFFFVQRRVSTNSKDSLANWSAFFLNSSLFYDQLNCSLGNQNALMQVETCFLRLSTKLRICLSFLSTNFNISSSFILYYTLYYLIMHIQKLLLFSFLLSISLSIQPTNFSSFLLDLSVNNMTHFTLLPFHKSSETMVFMFAGLADSIPTNNLYLVELATGDYEQFVGDPHPSARYKQCGVVNEYKLYIYGGYNENGTVRTDLWVFDSVFMMWFELGESGVQVEECSLFYSDEIIYVFGNNQTTTKSSVLKYDLSEDQWTVPDISFIESLELQGQLWEGTISTTYLDIGYVDDIDDSIIKGKIKEKQTLYSSVCTMSNGEESFLITENKIYKIDISLLQIQVIERKIQKNPVSSCLISDEWIFIFYLMNGQINIQYHAISNAAIHNEIFNIFNQTYATYFSAFLDPEYNIHLLIGDDLTSLVIHKQCSNDSSNISSCFYTQTICQEGYGGENCDIPVCPNSLILYDYVNYGSIVFQCSNHGQCTQSGCICDEYWSGDDCSNYMRTECNGEVIGNWPVVNCECLEETSGGNYCEVTFCYNDCTGRGTCGSDGDCVCDSGYAGPDCSITVIQFL